MIALCMREEGCSSVLLCCGWPEAAWREAIMLREPSEYLASGHAVCTRNSCLLECGTRAQCERQLHFSPVPDLANCRLRCNNQRLSPPRL